MKNMKKLEENCNFQKNEKMQFSSSFFFFHFFHLFFYLFFYFFFHFSSFFASSGTKIFQEMENYNFPRVFFSFFLKCLLPVVELMKNDKKWWKMIKKNETKNDKKNDKKMIKKMKKNEENCNFPKNEKLQFSPGFFHFFSLFYHVFIILHHFCFQWCKNFPRNGKLQFSSIFFQFFYHFFLYFFNHFCFQWWNWWKMIKHDEKW